MNAIYKKAIENAQKQCSLKPISNLIEALPNDCQESAVKYLLGILDPDEILPETSEISENAHLKSYDWLRNSVQYTCTETQKRYFATQEEADRFSSTGDYSWNKSSYCKSDECSIEAVFVNREYTKYTTRDEWVNAKKSQ